MDGFTQPQEPLLPEGATRVVNDLWPVAPARPERRPDSFSKQFGYTMLAQAIREAGARFKGLTAPERMFLAAAADCLDAGVSDDPEGMRDALLAMDEMERCRS